MPGCRSRPQPSNKNSFALRILQLNISGFSSSAMGVRRKLQVQSILHRERVDICCLQETNLGPDAELPRFRGYTVLRQDRRVGRDGTPATGSRGFGGVLVLVRVGVQFQRLPAPIASQDLASDVLAVRLHPPPPHGPFIVVNAYRPPIRSSSSDLRADFFDPGLFPRGPRVIVVGDFNAHHPLWDPFKPSDEAGERLDAWSLDADMTCVNSGAATRFDPASSTPSVPDVTFVSDRLAPRCEWRCLEDVSSDHLPVLITLHMGHALSSRPPKLQWCERKADWDRYAAEVLRALEPTVPTSQPLRALQSLENAIFRARSLSVPYGGRRDPKPWWTEEADRACAAARAAKRRWKRAPQDEQLKSLYKRAETEASRVVREAKAETFSEFLAAMDVRADPGAPFRLLRSMDAPSGDPRDAALSNGTVLATSDKAKANLVVSHYAQVNRIIRPKAPDLVTRTAARPPPCPAACPFCQPYTMQELRAALCRKGGRAAGPDGISPALIQHLPEPALIYLLDIFNALWTSKIYPTQWRRATIIPVLKKGKDPSRVESYRPISLTSNLGKLFERLAQARLQFWAESSGVLSPCQAGFRSFRSTEIQIARIAQYAMDGLQQQPMQRSLATFVDFSQAYDRVWKRGLLAKLNTSGVPPCLVRWTRSFLADRRARVCWGDTLSRERVLKEGLPQGSVVSPLLWLFYINDVTTPLSVLPEVQVSLYADDLALCVRGRDAARLASTTQQALNMISDWADDWSMTINSNKTESLLISTHPLECAGKFDPHLSIKGEPVRCSSEPVFLGVTFDSTLSFQAHGRKICDRVSRRVGLLRRMRGRPWARRYDLLRQAFLAYVAPVALYGASTWTSFAAPTTIGKVQAQLNGGLRTALGCPRGTNNAVLLAEAGTLGLRTHGTLLAATLRERALRLPVNDPLGTLFRTNCLRRLKSRRPAPPPARHVRPPVPRPEPPPTVSSPVAHLTSLHPPARRSCNALRLPTGEKCRACRLKRQGMRCARLGADTDEPPAGGPPLPELPPRDLPPPEPPPGDPPPRNHHLRAYHLRSLHPATLHAYPWNLLPGRCCHWIHNPAGGRRLVCDRATPGGCPRRRNACPVGGSERGTCVWRLLLPASSSLRGLPGTRPRCFSR